MATSPNSAVEAVMAAVAVAVAARRRTKMRWPWRWRLQPADSSQAALPTAGPMAVVVAGRRRTKMRWRWRWPPDSSQAAHPTAANTTLPKTRRRYPATLRKPPYWTTWRRACRRLECALEAKTIIINTHIRGMRRATRPSGRTTAEKTPTCNNEATTEEA